MWINHNWSSDVACNDAQPLMYRRQLHPVFISEDSDLVSSRALPTNPSAFFLSSTEKFCQPPINGFNSVVSDTNIAPPIHHRLATKTLEILFFARQYYLFADSITSTKGMFLLMSNVAITFPFISNRRFRVSVIEWLAA